MADPELPAQRQSKPRQPTLRQPSNSQPLDLETLVAEHGPVVYRYAYRLTGSAADAEDLTQQVFLTALAKIEQLRDPAAARAWLCSVLRRAYLRSQRKPRPQPAANLDVDVDLLAVDVPEELAFDSEELQQAIDALPDDFKLVVLGFYFEDCSYKELAERLELPIGTVMSRLSRAKGYLRAQLLKTATTPKLNQPDCNSNNFNAPIGEPAPVRHSSGRVRGETR
jgi:RNA polymerase sigma-70 factor (ECF subfamily)